jgi:hypothetical protein
MMALALSTASFNGPLYASITRNIWGAQEETTPDGMQTEQQLQYFDFTMFCMPDGSTFGLTKGFCFTAYPVTM